jgi:hypothetical protein
VLHPRVTVRGLPYLVAGMVIAEAVGPGEQAGVDVEGEEMIFGGRRGHVELGALGHELGAEPVSHGRILDQPDPARQVEGVLVVRRRKGVERVAPVAMQIPLLGGGDDESDQRVIGDEGAERMKSGAGVGSDGGQEGQSHPDLVEEVPAGIGQVRSCRAESGPGDHGPDTAIRGRS